MNFYLSTFSEAVEWFLAGAVGIVFTLIVGWLTRRAWDRDRSGLMIMLMITTILVAFVSVMIIWIGVGIIDCGPEQVECPF